MTNHERSSPGVRRLRYFEHDFQRPRHTTEAANEVANPLRILRHVNLLDTHATHSSERFLIVASSRCSRPAMAAWRGQARETKVCVSHFPVAIDVLPGYYRNLAQTAIVQRTTAARADLSARSAATLMRITHFVKQRFSAAMLGLLVLSAAARTDEASALKALKSAGARFTRDDKQPGMPVVGVNLSDPRPMRSATRVTDEVLKELKELKNLQTLNLYGAVITDAGMKELKYLKSLQSLNLQNTTLLTDRGVAGLSGVWTLVELKLGYNLRVTDAALRELKGLRGLQSLDLQHTRITDAGAKELKDLNLRTLDLSYTDVTNAGVKELRELTGLRTLHLYGTKLTDAGLRHVKEITSLQTLGIDGEVGTEEGLQELRSLKNLQSLSLWGGVSDAALREVKVLNDLKSLSLSSNDITDAGLTGIKELHDLQELRFSGPSQITDAGLKELRTLKGLRVLHLQSTQITGEGSGSSKR